MKYLYALPIFLFSFFNNTNTTEACDNLYSKVTYALSHSKKALGATNFEHQMYYAERALTAMEKAESYRTACGCVATEDTSFESIKNLEKAIEPQDWDAGRFYTKKSKSYIEQLITSLDECSFSANNDANEEILNADNNVSTETESLEKYTSAIKESIHTTDKQLVSLLETLTKETPNSSNEIKKQQEFYRAKTIELLRKNIEQLESKN